MQGFGHSTLLLTSPHRSGPALAVRKVEAFDVDRLKAASSFFGGRGSCPFCATLSAMWDPFQHAAAVDVREERLGHGFRNDVVVAAAFCCHRLKGTEGQEVV
ncbi:RGM domain family member B [Platysternon megacephalum]|uniref:RGM domain family member B n=1 Tax=Platysternon megacephalum TaxID=55544 RepID=A0A4D9ENY4_9SAUR|nr:RGM domain family member B [Platysternon megacephalum]